MREIILDSAPIGEFLLNLAMEVSKCDMRDTISFNRQLLEEVRNIIAIPSNLEVVDKDATYLVVPFGKIAEGQIRLKNGFQLNFSYYIESSHDDVFVLRELSNNKNSFSYGNLRYPYIDYKNPRNNIGEYYKIKICQ